MSFTLSNAEGLKAAEEFLSKNNYFSGEDCPNEKDVELLEQFKELPCNKTYPNLYGYLFDMILFFPDAKALWTKKQGDNKKEKKGKKGKKGKKSSSSSSSSDKEDEDLDLFGDDPELEAKVAKKKEADKAAAEKKKKKPAPVLKSRVVFDVKGYEVGQDFKSLSQKIKDNVKMEGLEWMNDDKVVPIGYGMMKLVMVMKIIDSVSSDDIFEKITELYEEEVQSVDIVDFQKA